jgi:thiol-disulfide isomerase/thioredoxin
MSYPAPRRTLSAAAVAALLLFFFLAADAPADNGLEFQVAELKERIHGLEEEVSELSAAVRSQHPDPAMEQEAARRLQGINALIRNGQTEQARAEMDDFMAAYGNTAAGKQAAATHRELSVVGREAPQQWNFTRWFQGENDIDLQSDGPTILVFWETWCPHCRREVPKLQNVYDRFADRGLQVLGVSRLSRGGTEEKMMAFIEEHDLGFPMAQDDGTLSAHFGVGGIPAVAVLQSGKVVWRGHPARLAPEMLESWMQ